MHARCPTFVNTPSHLTLASHSNTSTTSSPVFSQNSWTWVHPSLLAEPRLGQQFDDFQSNGQNDSTRRSAEPLAGLGIRYSTPVSRSGGSDSEDGKTYADPFDFRHHEHLHVPIYGCLDDGSESLLDTLNDDIYGFELKDSAPWPSPPLQASHMDESMLASDVVYNLDDTTLQYPPLEPTIWSFESFSAAPGVSADVLVAQVSLMAEHAIQEMTSEFASPRSLSSFTHGVLPSEISVNNITKERSITPSVSSAKPWPSLPNYPSEHVDTNTASPSQDLFVGVNPAYLGNLSWSPITSSSASTSSIGQPSIGSDTLAESEEDDDELKGKGETATGPPARDIIVEPEYSAVAFETGAYFDVYQLGKIDAENEASDYAPTPRLPSHSSPDSSPFPSPTRKAHSSTNRKRVRKPQKSIDPEIAPVKIEEGVSSINLGTPVFDAHRGIPLEQLKAKAERYMRRNPGHYEFDKRWLLSFVGKLSAQGLLVDDFRCYVDGCTQTNKRRDHITIHVGAHLNQRPFQCGEWYVLALRIPPMSVHRSNLPVRRGS